MPLINRTSLNDWNDHLKNDIVVSSKITQKYNKRQRYKFVAATGTNFTDIELPNGPYDTVDSAKAEIADLITIYEHVEVSDLNESNVFELSPNKNSLVLKTTRKSLKNGHRPLAEAGAPLDTLNVEFNQLKYQNQIRENSKNSWTQGIKKFDDLNTYNEMKTARTKQAVDNGFDSNTNEYFDVTDKLFEVLGSTNKESNYENSFLAIKKNISDPPTENVVHFMNQCNMTFVFETADSSVRDSYDTYLRDKFSLENQFTWDEDLVEHHKNGDSTYNWHCREMYHLVDDYYAITISKNSNCSNSHKIMNDLIANYEKLPFDWESYPGNLYIGNVCKILKS